MLSPCRLAGGAELVSWLLFSDGPVAGPGPVGAGEGPHGRQRSVGCVGAAWLRGSLHALFHSVILPH